MDQTRKKIKESLNYDVLNQFYSIEGKSATEIANIYGLNKKVIWRLLKKFDIKIRPPTYKRTARCLHCDNLVNRKPHQCKKSKKCFCSQECYFNYLKLHPNEHPAHKEETKKINLVCENCQTHYKKYPSSMGESEHHFCSQECYGEYKLKTPKQLNVKDQELKNKLENLYIRQKLTRGQIASQTGMSLESIHHYLHRFKILKPQRELVNKETLQRLYLEEGMSRPEIAKYLNENFNTINYLFNRYGISKPKIKEPTENELRKLYETDKKHMEEIRKLFGMSRKKLSSFFNKYNIQRRQQPPPPAINPKTGRGNGYKPKIKVNCKVCNKEMEKWPSKLKRSESFLCSDECLGKFRSEMNSGENNYWYNGQAGKTELECAHCNKKFRRYQHPHQLYNERNFCSVECCCKSNIGQGRKRNKFPKRGKYGRNWTQTKHQARRRDKKCRLCGKDPRGDGKRLTVHHNIKFDFFGKENYKKGNNLQNLACYCDKHHSLIERYVTELIWTVDFFREAKILETMSEDGKEPDCYSVYR